MLSKSLTALTVAFLLQINKVVKFYILGSNLVILALNIYMKPENVLNRLSWMISLQYYLNAYSILVECLLLVMSLW